ncbi:OmpA family protein [Enterovibrio calviensis]|uniref:OmpA family protein n=1 Tax=Enterovibrio calviensis TaxID=91359 RepID=UPI0004894F12|nr:OmpA family protein [Enterovibrio calviensis]
MKKILVTLSALLLLGCSSQEVVTMQGNASQVNDLRDLDYDGVIDAREKCDETLRDAAVDNDGCPRYHAMEKYQLNMNFDNGSAALQPSDYVKLERLASLLNEKSDANIIIEGHASKVGNAGYNLALSERRADAVMQALVNDFSIASHRIETLGFGDTELLVNEDSESAHEANRRAMATLSGSESSPDMRWTVFTAD